MSAVEEDGERLAHMSVLIVYDNETESLSNLTLYRDRVWAVEEASWGATALSKPDGRVRRWHQFADSPQAGSRRPSYRVRWRLVEVWRSMQYVCFGRCERRGRL